MILFENVSLLEFDPPTVSEPTELLIGDDGRIAALGPQARERAAAARASGSSVEAGGSGGYLSPGLAVGHAHLYSVLSRGMRVAIAPSADFVQMLDHLWWRLDRALDEGSVAASGSVGAAEAAFLGVTTIIDHHASPSFIDGSLSVLAKAIGDVGLRSVLCYETTDRNGSDGARAGLRENERYAAECASIAAAVRGAATRGADAVSGPAGTAAVPGNTASSGLSGPAATSAGKGCAVGPGYSGGLPLRGAMIGAHAPFTLGDDTLAALGDLVRRSGAAFHVHVAEDRYDASDSRARHGLDPIERLDRAGCLAPGSLVAHGLYLTGGELALLADRGVRLVHNARSNMNNGVGYAALLPRADGFLLGTDGLGADMLEELRFAYFKHRDAGGPLDGDAFVRALGRNGSAAVVLLAGVERTTGASLDARALAAGVGDRGNSANAGNGNPDQGADSGAGLRTLVPGAPADLVHWDYRSPTPLGSDNLSGHLLFGMSTRDLRSTLVGGRFIVKDRRAAFDAERIAAQGREEAARLWKRMNQERM